MSNKDRFSFSSMRKDQVKVPAYGYATIQYADSFPNYFRVQNAGKAKVLCGTAVIPSPGRYDFQAPPEGLQMYAEPNKRSRLYLYNPSGTACECTVLAFEAPFDPLALALGGMEVRINTEGLSISTEITAFDSPLPAGSNKIGNVGVTGALPAGSNKIGNVGVTGSLPAGTNEIGVVGLNAASLQKLSDIISTLINQGGAIGSKITATNNLLTDIKSLLTSIDGKLTDAEGVNY